MQRIFIPPGPGTYLLFFVPTTKKVHERHLRSWLVEFVDTPPIHYKKAWIGSYSKSRPECLFGITIHFADSKALIRRHMKVGGHSVIGTSKLLAVPAPVSFHGMMMMMMIVRVMHQQIKSTAIRGRIVQPIDSDNYSPWSVEFNKPYISVTHFVGKVLGRQWNGIATWNGILFRMHHNGLGIWLTSCCCRR